MNRHDIRANESATLSTLKAINSKLFMLEYKGDYGLDELLERGSKDILSTVRFLQKRVRRLTPAINPLPGGFACSAFNTENGSGQPIMGRNFDYKESPCIVCWTAPKNGFRSMSTLTANFMLYGIKHQRLDRAKRPLRLMGAPFVCMDGINEKGLAIAILEIKAKPTKQSAGKTPIIPPVAVRAALDKCSNVNEAVRLFSKYDMQDLIGVNYHYFIADASGASAIIEYVDNEMKVLPQQKQCENLVLTNYFLSEGGDNTKGRGFDRFRSISDRLGECGYSLSEEEAMQLLSRNTLFYHHKWMPHMVKTVWSTVFNCAERTQLTCAGMDYSTAYRFALDAPCRFEAVRRSAGEDGGIAAGKERGRDDK